MPTWGEVMADELEGEFVAFVDCESTGVAQHDEPISIGVVLVQLDAKGYGEPIAEWYGEQEPSVAMHPAAKRVHGKSPESLAGKVFDVAGLRAILDRTEILIAHQASFDARMMLKVIPDLMEWEWRCTRRQWPWNEMENKKLDTVCAHFGIDRPATHDALADAHALRQAVMQRSGKTERSRTYMHKLMGRGECDVRPKVRQARPEPRDDVYVGYSAPPETKPFVSQYDHLFATKVSYDNDRRPTLKHRESGPLADGQRKADATRGAIIWIVLGGAALFLLRACMG